MHTCLCCRRTHLHSSQNQCKCSCTEILRSKILMMCKMLKKKVLLLFPGSSILNLQNMEVEKSIQKILAVSVFGIFGFTALNSTCQIVRSVQWTATTLKHCQLLMTYGFFQILYLQSLQLFC